MNSGQNRTACTSKSAGIPAEGSSLSTMYQVYLHLLTMLLLLTNLAPTRVRSDQLSLQSTLIARRDFMTQPAFLFVVAFGIAVLLPTLNHDGVVDLTLLFLLIPIFVGFWASLDRCIKLNGFLIEQKVYRHHFLYLITSSIKLETRTISPLQRPPAVTA